jgi:hypothetical protein
VIQRQLAFELELSAAADRSGGVKHEPAPSPPLITSTSMTRAAGRRRPGRGSPDANVFFGYN